MKSKLVFIFLISLLSTQLFAFDNKRQGFMLGLGAGLHTLNSEQLHQSGFSTSLKIGGGLNEHLQLYYVRDASWTKEASLSNASDDIVARGITGFGVTYYLNPTPKTVFVSGGVGLGDEINITDSDADMKLGAAGLIGVGYIYNHLMIESKLLYIGLDVPATSVNLTLSYLFF